MRKNLVAALSIAALSMSLFTGCGNNSGTEETKGAEETAAAMESNKETEGMETDSGTAEAETKAVQGENGLISDTNAAGWHIVIEDVQSDRSLENVSVDLGYSGVETSDFKKEAGEGNVFFLVKLMLEKEDSTEVVDWQGLVLTDAEGNEYHRLEDEFLTDLGMTRMAGTALNFGSNEGWIAYEVKEGATGLRLSYAFTEETFTCELPSIQ